MAVYNILVKGKDDAVGAALACLAEKTGKLDNLKLTVREPFSEETKKRIQHEVLQEVGVHVTLSLSGK